MCLCLSDEDFFEPAFPVRRPLPVPPLDLAKGEAVRGVRPEIDSKVSRAWPELSTLSAEILRFLKVAMGSGS